MIASSVFWGGGAYGSLPDTAIWWCLQTGGGGVLTSFLDVKWWSKDVGIRDKEIMILEFKCGF